MAKQKEKRGYVIGLQRPRWVSLLFFRFVSFVPSEHFWEHLGYSALKGNRANTLETRLYSRAIRKPFIVVAPFPRFFWGNEIFQFEICPWIDVCMCCVSLKWWLERGASIELERIGNAIYCGECLSICCNGNVVLHKWNLCEVSFCGKNGNWKKANHERS